jgi:hypothetical protein
VVSLLCTLACCVVGALRACVHPGATVVSLLLLCLLQHRYGAWHVRPDTYTPEVDPSSVAEVLPVVQPGHDHQGPAWRVPFCSADVFSASAGSLGPSEPALVALMSSRFGSGSSVGRPRPGLMQRPHSAQKLAGAELDALLRQAARELGPNGASAGRARPATATGARLSRRVPSPTAPPDCTDVCAWQSDQRHVDNADCGSGHPGNIDGVAAGHIVGADGPTAMLRPGTAVVRPETNDSASLLASMFSPAPVPFVFTGNSSFRASEFLPETRMLGSRSGPCASVRSSSRPTTATRRPMRRVASAGFVRRTDVVKAPPSSLLSTAPVATTPWVALGLPDPNKAVASSSPSGGASPVSLGSPLSLAMSSLGRSSRRPNSSLGVRRSGPTGGPVPQSASPTAAPPLFHTVSLQLDRAVSTPSSTHAHLLTRPSSANPVSNQYAHPLTRPASTGPVSSPASAYPPPHVARGVGLSSELSPPRAVTVTSLSPAGIKAARTPVARAMPLVPMRGVVRSPPTARSGLAVSSVVIGQPVKLIVAKLSPLPSVRE